MKVIVTGGAGFIGSHLSKRLIADRHEVMIIDNLHDYYAVERKKQQLEQVQKKGSVIFKQDNLLNYHKTLTSFQDFKPELVVHLAALPGVSHSILAPIDYVDIDIKATINVLKAAGETGVKQVIFSSSSSVYGNLFGQAISEDMATGKVISPYAAAKYSAEAFCHTYEYLYGYQMSILRFFTVYGPWGRPDMAISKFINQLLNNEEITVYGTGTARDYTFIEDVIDGIISVIKYSNNSEVFNIGSSAPIKIEELLQYLQKHFPSMKVNYDSHRTGDVLATWADISKAKMILAYNPKWSFENGLAQTVEWAKKYASF